MFCVDKKIKLEKILDLFLEDYYLIVVKKILNVELECFSPLNLNLMIEKVIDFEKFMNAIVLAGKCINFDDYVSLGRGMVSLKERKKESSEIKDNLKKAKSLLEEVTIKDFDRLKFSINSPICVVSSSMTAYPFSQELVGNKYWKDFIKTEEFFKAIDSPIPDNVFNRA